MMPFTEPSWRRLAKALQTWPEQVSMASGAGTMKRSKRLMAPPSRQSKPAGQYALATLAPPLAFAATAAPGSTARIVARLATIT